MSHTSEQKYRIIPLPDGSQMLIKRYLESASERFTSTDEVVNPLLDEIEKQAEEIQAMRNTIEKLERKSELYFERILQLYADKARLVEALKETDGYLYLLSETTDKVLINLRKTNQQLLTEMEGNENKTKME